MEAYRLRLIGDGLKTLIYWRGKDHVGGLIQRILGVLITHVSCVHTKREGSNSHVYRHFLHP